MRRIDATIVAVKTYNSEREAVVIDSRPEGIFVMVIWDGGTCWSERSSSDDLALQPNTQRRVPLEERRRPDVDARHRKRPVPGLLGDPVFRHFGRPCQSACAICSSLNRLFLIDLSSRLPPKPSNEPESPPFVRFGPG